MTDLDKLIHEVIIRRADRDLDGITQDVQADLPDDLRKSLVPSPAVSLYRLIRRRVRGILRHDPLQPSLPGLQNHYSTPIKGIWISLTEMSFETAMWVLDRLDRRRKAADAEHATFLAWMREAFPERFEAEAQRRREGQGSKP